MYSVSDGYLSAVRSECRTDRISGTIHLSGGSSIEINDNVLVKDTLKISRQLCSGSYRIGTFDLSRLKFSFFLADALGLDLTGAYADLTYGLLVGESYENVPLGRFYIDPVLSTRRRDIVSIVGFDAGVMFDRQPSDELRTLVCTPPELIEAVCGECGVPTDITAGSLSEMPNSGISVCASEKQIQTCRDIIMWCAALMCGYAVIGRDGKLNMISAKYEVDQEDPSVIIVDRNIRQDERESINSTDTRAYIKYLTAYVGSDVVNYTSTYVSPDEQASPASYVLEKNPLTASLTDAQCSQANSDWLAYISAFKQRGVEARIFGDPAIDTGDTIMFRGGDVDQRSGIAGVVTSVEWCYRKYTDIRCLAAQCCGSLESGSAAVAGGSAQVRSQSGKRMDSLGTGSGSGTGKFLDAAKTSVAHNDLEHNTSEGIYDSVNGYKNTITGTPQWIDDQITRGGANTAFGQHNTIVNTQGALVWGGYNRAENGSYNTVGGTGNNVGGSFNTVLGTGNRTGNVGMSLVHGAGIIADGLNSSALFGQGHYISGNAGADYILVTGVGARAEIPASSTKIGLLFIAAYNGNKVTIDTSGNVQAAGTYGTMGADYAEYFEWEDGNPDSEDRRGMLVSVRGDKIVLADGDDISGIVSASPSVSGNAAELYWDGKYRKDVFGCIVKDENGEPVLSDDYEPERKYIPRSRRKEWAAVGLVGRLIVRDDGSCKVGGYVSAKNGIAVRSDFRTGIKVLRRTDETHVEVLIR